MKLLQFLVMICLTLCASAAPPAPVLTDSDGDGYLDGPDVWKDGYLHRGEDLNQDGKIEGFNRNNQITYHESDPHDARSIRRYFNETLPSIEKDSDGDGLPDYMEDVNGNGRFDPGEPSIFLDADTDDDGLSDAFERGYVRHILPGNPETGPTNESTFNRTGLDPKNPDTDGDGLPDGLELGIHTPLDGVRPYLAFIPGPPIKDTDLNATFEYKRKQRNGSITIEKRKCFIPDLDPSTITNACNADTNYDGVPDGEQDANCNGRCDPGETDAAVGFIPVNWKKGAEILSTTQTVIAYYRKSDRDIVEREGYGTYYQSPSKDEVTTKTFKVINPLAIEFISCKRIFPGLNLWFVAVEWRKPSDKATEIWAEDPRFIRGKSKMIRLFCLPPQDESQIGK